mgnify:CR=1
MAFVDFDTQHWAVFNANMKPLSSVRRLVRKRSADGLSAEELVRNLWTPPLEAMFKTSAKNTIMNSSNHKLDQHMPLISDWDTRMFLTAFDDENDSASAKELDRFKFAPLTAQ